jgi:hypothetical protein
MVKSFIISNSFALHCSHLQLLKKCLRLTYFWWGTHPTRVRFLYMGSSRKLKLGTTQYFVSLITRSLTIRTSVRVPTSTSKPLVGAWLNRMTNWWESEILTRSVIYSALGPFYSFRRAAKRRVTFLRGFVPQFHYRPLIVRLFFHKIGVPVNSILNTAPNPLFARGSYRIQKDPGSGRAIDNKCEDRK